MAVYIGLRLRVNGLAGAVSWAHLHGTPDAADLGGERAARDGLHREFDARPQDQWKTG
jgi:hypothetical protein